MMAKKKYTDEHIDYLREISPGRYNDEVTKLFNERFGMNVTETAIRTLRQKNGIKLGVTKSRMQYSIEQLAYLQELSAQGLFNAEITRLFNKKFGTKRTEIAIQQQRCKYGFKTDARYYWQKGHTPWNKGKKGMSYEGMEATQFKPGNRPHTWVPVGSEVITKDGYTKIKVAEPNKWRLKHRVIWEKHHGRPVPPGHAVIFGDGNRCNFDPDNLILVSRAQLAMLNKNRLIQGNADLTRTGVVIADIYQKIGDLKKGKGGAK